MSATVFVAGLQGIGLIRSLQAAMQNASVAGWVLPLLLVGLTAVIVILSGSGTALFFAMVPLMYGLAAAAGISALAVTVPMGMAGNLLRAASPVAAVVVIVAGATKESPINIVKRTWFPMVIGVVCMFVLSMFMFL
ncbi:Na+/H+ antiporter NhaC family protein [Propioniciclava coleopterorum]|uniref:Na+/H+ antiporter NhaC family protein n=1 Tax=Propioniciclava coleopterorum TaxID=2714937 RepID=UPI001981E8CE|nr:Na+/H+ antiporter NhaC family protein [Propioniciclava coleopterorum]